MLSATREADLRFSLVRVNEHIDAIALAAGEADEDRRIEVDLAAPLYFGTVPHSAPAHPAPRDLSVLDAAGVDFPTGGTDRRY
jgi:hypothetical protein